MHRIQSICWKLEHVWLAKIETVENSNNNPPPPPKKPSNLATTTNTFAIVCLVQNVKNHVWSLGRHPLPSHSAASTSVHKTRSCKRCIISQGHVIAQRTAGHKQATKPRRWNRTFPTWHLNTRGFQVHHWRCHGNTFTATPAFPWKDGWQLKGWLLFDGKLIWLKS